MKQKKVVIYNKCRLLLCMAVISQWFCFYFFTFAIYIFIYQKAGSVLMPILTTGLYYAQKKGYQINDTLSA